MSNPNSKSKFQRELALANEAMLNHFPLVSIPEVFAGAPQTLRETLETIVEKVGDIESVELDSALTRLTILCAVFEHHLFMARIQRRPVN